LIFRSEIKLSLIETDKDMGNQFSTPPNEDDNRINKIQEHLDKASRLNDEVCVIANRLKEQYERQDQYRQQYLKEIQHMGAELETCFQQSETEHQAHPQQSEADRLQRQAFYDIRDKKLKQVMLESRQVLAKHNVHQRKSVSVPSDDKQEEREREQDGLYSPPTYTEKPRNDKLGYGLDMVVEQFLDDTDKLQKWLQCDPDVDDLDLDQELSRLRIEFLKYRTAATEIRSKYE
jgi:hypothetical protein